MAWFCGATKFCIILRGDYESGDLLLYVRNGIVYR